MKHRKSRINATASSRKPKRMNLESIDRISGLPDSILGIILSFLPTKNAVSTSLLSKRWKLVWTMVHNLDFDLWYEDFLGRHDENEDMRFVGFVNRVLQYHDAGWLNKFHLVWAPWCISSHASSWISTAVSKNVHELLVRLETHPQEGREFSDFYTFVMPTCVFSCDTLRILRLDGGICVSEPVAVWLPKLESITLESIYFQSEEAFGKLIRGCPMLINLRITLEEYMLIELYQDDDFTYRISSTSLRRLEIDIQDDPEPPAYLNMELEAPSLEYLSLHGFIPVFLVKKSLESLVEAKLDADLGEKNFSNVRMCNLVVEAVRVFDRAKALVLSAHFIWALSCATTCLSTEFKRLVKLEAGTYTCACSSLQYFIECSDNLEVLMVNEIDSFWGAIENDLPKWIAPVQVPKCFSNSLKKVVIKGFYGMEDEREMVRYILKHGNALEDIDISFHHSFIERDQAKLELVREICEFSKKLSSKLPVCEVKFVGETSKCNFKVH